MNKELFKNYVNEVKLEKEAKERKDALKPLIIAETRKIITELGSANLKTDLGTFSLTEKKTYTYSEDYKAKEVKVGEEVAPLQAGIEIIKEEQINPLEAKIKDIQSVLDVIKKEEEENGKAECKTTDSLRFTAKKVKEEEA